MYLPSDSSSDSHRASREGTEKDMELNDKDTNHPNNYQNGLVTSQNCTAIKGRVVNIVHVCIFISLPYISMTTADWEYSKLEDKMAHNK